MTRNPLRAVVYARVSQDTRQGRSTIEQAAECRNVCAREGWQVVAELEDRDISASRYARKTRPAFAELVALIDRGGVDVLVAWESSRLSRDLKAWAQLRDLCRERGVLWSYSGRTYDLARTDDAFAAGLDALVGERESSATRDRILRAVRANAAAGRPHGRTLWGYQRIYDPHTAQFVRQDIVPETAQLVRWMAAETLAGRSSTSIARELNDRGVPLPLSGRPWTFVSVVRTLSNPGYAGYRVHRGEIIGRGVWEPILDEVTWRRLQAVLDGRRTGRKYAGVKHLLSGVAVCGVCDGPLEWHPRKGKASEYRCRGGHVGIGEDRLDGIVSGMLLRRLASHATSPLLAAAAGTDPVASRALADADAERARLETFYEQAATGELSAGALAKIEQRILARVADLESRAVRTVPGSVLRLTGPDARAEWQGMPMDMRRSIIRAFMRPALHRASAPRRVTEGWLRP